MAVAAFKSSSKRGNLSTPKPKPKPTNSNAKDKSPPPPKKVPVRRSRSVSAFSRSNNNTDVSSDFLIKTDNPLFWSSTSPPPPDTEIQSDDTKHHASTDNNSRGRSLLSRPDTARRYRSVSRCPLSNSSRRHYLNSESEAEQSESSFTRDFKNTSNWNGKKGGLVRTSSGMTWSSQHSLPDDAFATASSCSHTPNWEDGVSTITSFSGAEEKTIKDVCEQVESVQGDDTTASGIYQTVRSEVWRAISDIQNDLESAIRRSNATAITTTSIADIPPDLVNPGAVELVLDIRREYAKKLEQSLDRARKLQEDLAVEEHRGHELSRILKEVLPDPKTPNVQKSRPGRKTSIERRKMSKRLAEEAMAYFDECVSLSTFDSSDFSSPEDPPHLANQVGNSVSLPQASLGTSVTSVNDKQESVIQGLFTDNHEASGLMASSSSKEPNLYEVSPSSANAERGLKFQFSFAHKTTESFELQQDLRKCIRKFEKHDTDSEIKRSNCYNVDEYNMQASTQSLLFDRVILKTRIESGSLLLCGGGMAISFSPFASII